MDWKLLNCKEFIYYSEQWNELNCASQNLPILEADFVGPLINQFFKGDEVLALGYENQQLVTAGFFHQVGFAHWASVMPSQAPLCLWVAQKHAMDDTIFRSLAAALPGLVLMIDLLQVDTRDLVSPHTNNFEHAHYITTGNRPIAEDFDQYFNGLGKNLRQNYNKVINRAAKSGDVLATRRVTSPEDVQDAVIQYGKIENQGWKAKEGTAVSPNNDQGAFYLEMLTNMAKRDQACVWYYLINDNIAAVDLCIQSHETLIILKTTYDESFNKQSPALQLKIEMLKYYAVNDENVKNIEFFGKTMEWHKRLDSKLRDIQHFTWFKNQFLHSIINIIKRLKLN
jgi:CelD/BcsL family acetyltransferase involved in cellulose biosynthesis